MGPATWLVLGGSGAGGKRQRRRLGRRRRRRNLRCGDRIINWAEEGILVVCEEVSIWEDSPVYLGGEPERGRKGQIKGLEKGLTKPVKFIVGSNVLRGRKGEKRGVCKFLYRGSMEFRTLVALSTHFLGQNGRR